MPTLLVNYVCAEGWERPDMGRVNYKWWGLKLI